MTRFRWRHGQHSTGQDRLARRPFRAERNRDRQPGPARGCVVPVPLPIGTTGWGHPERVVKRLGCICRTEATGISTPQPRINGHPRGPYCPPRCPRKKLGREPINLPGGRLAEVRYAPIATKFCDAAKCRDGPTADIQLTTPSASDRRRGSPWPICRSRRQEICRIPKAIRRALCRRDRRISFSFRDRRAPH
jgi:hypothetical protein